MEQNFQTKKNEKIIYITLLLTIHIYFKFVYKINYIKCQINLYNNLKLYINEGYYAILFGAGTPWGGGYLRHPRPRSAFGETLFPSPSPRGKNSPSLGPQ